MVAVFCGKEPIIRFGSTQRPVGRKRCRDTTKSSATWPDPSAGIFRWKCRRERSGGRRTEDGGRSVRPAPNPRAGKPVPRGMGFPAHVGATADRRSRRAAHAIWQRTDGRGRSVRPVPNPRAGKPVARGMGFPAHVGATADRRSRRAAHAIWQQARLNTSSEVLGAYD